MKKNNGILGLILAIVMAIACPIAVNAAAADAVDLDGYMMETIGCEMDGYYAFCINQITDCFALMDSELHRVAGVDVDMAGAFEASVNDTIERFAGVEDEASAFDELKKIISEVTKNAE